MDCWWACVWSAGCEGAFGNNYMCCYEQAESLTGIVWGLVQVGSTSQNSLNRWVREKWNGKQVQMWMKTMLRSHSQSVLSVLRHLQYGNEIADCVWCPLYMAMCWDLRGGMPLNPQPAGSQLFHGCWLLHKAPAHRLVQDLKFQKSVASSRYLLYFSWCSFTYNILLPHPLLGFYLYPMNTVVRGLL